MAVGRSTTTRTMTGWQAVVEALRAEAAVKASEANIELNQQLLKLAQDRNAVGIATGIDVTREQVQLENER